VERGGAAAADVASAAARRDDDARGCITSDRAVRLTRTLLPAQGCGCSEAHRSGCVHRRRHSAVTCLFRMCTSEWLLVRRLSLLWLLCDDGWRWQLRRQDKKTQKVGAF
jgi:hypothetical protein